MLKEVELITFWENQLKIRTSGRDDTKSDTYRYPYEPTPYCVLEELSKSGLIKKKNTLVDYGCGKGRVGFYISHNIRCKSIGIEYDKRMYDMAIFNKNNCVSGHITEFENVNAEDYLVPKEADRFYFFNPFSVELLEAVLSKIIKSYYENFREMYLFFYYPSDEYIAKLMTVDEFEFYDEIDLRGLFRGNDEREKIIVFRIGEMTLQSV